MPVYTSLNGYLKEHVHKQSLQKCRAIFLDLSLILFFHNSAPLNLQSVACAASLSHQQQTANSKQPRDAATVFKVSPWNKELSATWSDKHSPCCLVSIRQPGALRRISSRDKKTEQQQQHAQQRPSGQCVYWGFLGCHALGGRSKSSSQWPRASVIHLPAMFPVGEMSPLDTNTY